jgi:hypothetical protein
LSNHKQLPPGTYPVRIVHLDVTATGASLVLTTIQSPRVLFTIDVPELAPQYSDEELRAREAVYSYLVAANEDRGKVVEYMEYTERYDGKGVWMRFWDNVVWDINRGAVGRSYDQWLSQQGS